MSDAGVDLDVLYQLIWRHLLAIELIQCNQNFENEAKAKNYFAALHDKFARGNGTKEKRKKSALSQLERYLSAYNDKTVDRVENIVKKIEGDLVAGINLEEIGIPVSFTASLSAKKETREKVVQRAQAVINNIDLRDLGEIINLLADDVFNDPMQETFIVIDELDERWVDTKVKYDLIRALIESIKKFRKIRRAKVVIALREDLLEKVLRETRFEGGQEEKFEDLFQRLRWKPEELRNIIEKRIKWLFENKYTSKEITFSDIFGSKVQDEEPFNYMLDRTLQRPRDIIQFANYCFESSEGQTQVKAKSIREAETRYSKRRYEALLQEWEIVNPLTDICCELLENQKSKFSLANFTKNEAENFAIKILEKESKGKNDPVFIAASEYIENKLSRRKFLRKTIQELYKVGVVGIKNSKYPTLWSYLHEPLISSAEINEETIIFIHPMLWRHLGVHQQNISNLNIRA